NWVLSRMHKLGHINTEEYEDAVNTKDHARYHHSFIASDGGYMAEMARRFAVNEFGADAYTNGLRIITTLDRNLQRSAVTNLRDQLHNYDERHGWRGSKESVDISSLPEQRSEEHTSELQSRFDLVCRLLLEKKKKCSAW